MDPMQASFAVAAERFNELGREDVAAAAQKATRPWSIVMALKEL